MGRERQPVLIREGFNMLFPFMRESGIFFRPFKAFLRHIEDFVLMYDVDVQLRQRNNTIKLISLVHNQFCSERFRGMICYSWYACGYCDEKPATFQTPVEFCFDQSSASSCDLCTTSQFITCGWCKAELCINHFLLQYHFCNNYVE